MSYKDFFVGSTRMVILLRKPLLDFIQTLDRKDYFTYKKFNSLILKKSNRTKHEWLDNTKTIFAIFTIFLNNWLWNMPLCIWVCAFNYKSLLNGGPIYRSILCHQSGLLDFFFLSIFFFFGSCQFAQSTSDLFVLIVNAHMIKIKQEACGTHKASKRREFHFHHLPFQWLFFSLLRKQKERNYFSLKSLSKTID